MKNQKANSFPELTFLYLSVNGNKPATAEQITHWASVEETAGRLVVDIISGYPKYSSAWTGILTSGITRDACANAAIHETKARLFKSTSGVSSEPWKLTETPLTDESYGEFRIRVRGIARNDKVSTYDPASTTTYFDKYQFAGRALHVIHPTDADGDGKHHIHIFCDGVEYRDANGMTSRTDGKPAVFKLNDGIMEFYLEGVMHRTDGPAQLYSEDPRLDCLAIKGVSETELGEVADCADKYVMILMNRGLLARTKRAAFEKELLSYLYAGFEDFAQDWDLANELYIKYLGGSSSELALKTADQSKSIPIAQ